MTTLATSKPALAWPRKYDLFDVQVSATTYQEACDVLIAAAQEKTPAVASLHAAHAVVTSSLDRDLLRKVNQFDIVATDGQPVRLGALWADTPAAVVFLRHYG